MLKTAMCLASQGSYCSTLFLLLVAERPKATERRVLFWVCNVMWDGDGGGDGGGGGDGVEWGEMVWVENTLLTHCTPYAT